MAAILVKHSIIQDFNKNQSKLSQIWLTNLSNSNWIKSSESNSFVRSRVPVCEHDAQEVQQAFSMLYHL